MHPAAIRIDEQMENSGIYCCVRNSRCAVVFTFKTVHCIRLPTRLSSIIVAMYKSHAARAIKEGPLKGVSGNAGKIRMYNQGRLPTKLKKKM